MNDNSFLTVFKKSFKIFVQNWAQLLLIVFFIFCLFLAYMLIQNMAFYLLTKYNIINETNVFLSKLIIKIITTIITYLIAVLAQFLMINNLIKNENELTANLKSFKQYFWNFLAVTIIINILFSIVTLPVYVAVALIILNKFVLGGISIIVGIILAVLLTSLLVFSPFILIAEKKSWYASLGASFSLATKNLWGIIFNLILLVLLLILINGIAVLILPVYFVGAILGSLIYLFIIIYAFVFLFALYQNAQARV